MEKIKKVLKFLIAISILFLISSCTGIDEHYDYKKPSKVTNWGEVSLFVAGEHKQKDSGAYIFYFDNRTIYFDIDINNERIRKVRIIKIKLFDSNRVLDIELDDKSKGWQRIDIENGLFLSSKKYDFQYVEYRIKFEIEIETENKIINEKIELELEKDYKKRIVIPWFEAMMSV